MERDQTIVTIMPIPCKESLPCIIVVIGDIPAGLLTSPAILGINPLDSFIHDGCGVDIRPKLFHQLIAEFSFRPRCSDVFDYGDAHLC